MWLARQPLAERSGREYLRNVRAFCVWLDSTPERAGWAADPLTDPIARDHAVRDFRRFLQVERRAAPATVNLALASLDALYRQRELGRPNVRRDKPAEAGPRALDVEQQRRLLRAAEHASERDRAIVAVLLYTALRLNELARSRGRADDRPQGPGARAVGQGREDPAHPAQRAGPAGSRAVDRGPPRDRGRRRASAVRRAGRATGRTPRRSGCGRGSTGSRRTSTCPSCSPSRDHPDAAAGTAHRARRRAAGHAREAAAPGRRPRASQGR